MYPVEARLITVRLAKVRELAVGSDKIHLINQQSVFGPLITPRS